MAVVPLSKLERTKRFDSEYFRHKYMSAAHQVAAVPNENVSALTGVSDGNHFTISSDFVEEGIPYYRGQDVVGHFFVEQSSPNFISREAYERPFMARSHLKRGDVLLSIIGTIGELSLVASDSAATCSCKLAILRPHSIAPEFLAVALRSKFGRLQIQRMTRGAVQMGLILEDMDQLLVPRFSKAFESAVAEAVRQAKKRRDASVDAISEAEADLVDALGLSNWSPPEPLSYSRKLSALSAAGRWDSQFHLPKVDDALSRLSKRFELAPIGSLGEVTNGNPVPYSEGGTIPIIRSGDLADLEDVDRLLRTNDPNYFPLKRGDVLISSIGFGSIGKVQVFDKPGPFGTVSEVTVIRQKKMDPYYLAAYLRSQPGQLQIDRWITGATGQLHLYPRDVRRIQVPIVEPKIQSTCRKVAERAREHRRKADSLLEAAKRAVEIAIEDSEKAALRFLKDVGE